jgi:hypothetical protein
MIAEFFFYPCCCIRGAVNHSPNASRIQDWQVKMQTHSPVWGVFFPLSYPFYIFGQSVSDFASENTELFASLASVLQNISTPLVNVPYCALNSKKGT